MNINLNSFKITIFTNSFSNDISHQANKPVFKISAVPTTNLIRTFDPPKFIVRSGRNASTILAAAPTRKYSDLFVSQFNPQVTVDLQKSELFSEFDDVTVT